MSDAVFEQVRERLAGVAGEATVAHGTLALEVGAARLVAVVRTLKDELGFDMFLDVTAVDWPDREPRFDVVWHFYSTRHFVRIRLKARVTLADPTVDTLVPFYGWLMWLNPGAAAFPGASAQASFMVGAGGHNVWIEPAFDAVLVDAQMPGGGPSVLDHLRESDYSGVAVLMTGAIAADATGISDRVRRLQKPFHFRSVIPLLEGSLPS